MTVPVLQKLGIKREMRSIFVNAPPEAVEAIGLPDDQLATELVGVFEYIHVFVMRQDDLDSTFPKLKPHLLEGGMLWVSWPKAKALDSDLTLPKVIEIGYSHGLVESKTISVTSIWSAIKFTYPKQGKLYNNSYGQLGKRHQ